MSVPPRRHRLPQRLDWTLIPPPLDLSRPIVDGLSPLPAIIVTPSSPTHARDFRIAFLAPESKEEKSLSERVFSRLSKEAVTSKSPPSPLLNFKSRTWALLFFPIFIVFCHFLTSRLGARHPHLRFDAPGTEGGEGGRAPGWFDMNDYWDGRHARNFIIEENPSPSAQ